MERELFVGWFPPRIRSVSKAGQVKARSFIRVSHVVAGARVLGLSPSSRHFSGELDLEWNSRDVN